VIELDAATVLLQWAVGGLLFLWVTTRRREVGIGYGWLLRGVYGVMASLLARRWRYRSCGGVRASEASTSSARGRWRVSLR
jgi:hypothetical protein